MAAITKEAADTNRAKTRAIQKSGKRSYNRLSRGKKQNSKWTSGLPEGITGVDRGYGGMGYGPTAQKALQRANPSAITREVLGAISQPKTVRAQGSIWDDPIYGQMANERGAEFAMRARDLDRQINSAQRMRDIQKETMRDQGEIEDMKLQNMQRQWMMDQYGGTGEQPAKLATDATGAYTGEGHQARMQGPGPMSEGEQASLQRQHEVRKEAINALTKALSAELGKDYNDPASQRRIQGLQDQLDRLIGGGRPATGGDAETGGRQGGETTGSGAETGRPEGAPEGIDQDRNGNAYYTDPDTGEKLFARQRSDGKWFVQKNGKWFQVDQDEKKSQSDAKARTKRQPKQSGLVGAPKNKTETKEGKKTQGPLTIEEYDKSVASTDQQSHQSMVKEASERRRRMENRKMASELEESPGKVNRSKLEFVINNYDKLVSLAENGEMSDNQMQEMNRAIAHINKSLPSERKLRPVATGWASAQ